MIPSHVTIIMDGNGRWARKQGEERLFGHSNGVESVRACTEYAVEKGIRYLSLFAFSEENWNRPEAEVSGLMSLMLKYVMDERDTFAKNDIRFMVIGNREHIAPELLSKIEMVENETINNKRLTLIIMLSYSGKWDIQRAAALYAKDYAAGCAKDFESYLATAGIPDPDLLIRTSGEQRISNYMLWQTAYTEFYFTETLWPDFRKADFEIALKSYESRDRRYGLIK